MFISYKKQLVILTLLILAVGLFIFFWKHDAEEVYIQTGPQWGEVDFSTLSIPDDEVIPEESVPEPEPQQEWAEHKNTSYGFSFSYPAYFQVGSFEDRGGETILFQETNQRQGFQIFIIPFDEDIDMTEERIRKDIPSMDIRGAQVVELGERSGKGLAFLSDNEAFGGNSREVWFVFNEHLYQISTYASLDTLLQTILNTWKFN